jgi:hypothetical protein
MTKNAAPPFSAALVGKPQILPSPTAEPEAAKINASREENSPLCITLFLLFFSCR